MWSFICKPPKRYFAYFFPNLNSVVCSCLMIKIYWNPLYRMKKINKVKRKHIYMLYYPIYVFVYILWHNNFKRIYKIELNQMKKCTHAWVIIIIFLVCKFVQCYMIKLWKRRSPIWQDKKAERNKAQIYDVLSHKFSICILRHIIKETRIYPSTLTNVGFVEEDGVLKGKSNCEVIKRSMGQIPGGVWKGQGSKFFRLFNVLWGD